MKHTNLIPYTNAVCRQAIDGISDTMHVYQYAIKTVGNNSSKIAHKADKAMTNYVGLILGSIE